MAGFQTKAMIPFLEGILAALDGMEHVQRGEPLDPPANVHAYILIGGQQPTRVSTGNNFKRTGHFLVMFVVRTRGEEDETEDILADLYDAFEDAILADPTCGGLTTNIELDTSAADNPEYRRMYGPEFRIYPVTVIASQRARIS